jgi:hypothetical protein
MPFRQILGICSVLLTFCFCGAAWAPAVRAGDGITASDFHYLGAFRLPEGRERPDTFAYGGNAMTYNPNGDANGAADGFSGSLFVSGHDRMAYGELPGGGRVAEVTIPRPVVSRTLNQLPRADILQPLTDVAKDRFSGRDELPRMGMQYLDTPATGPKIHLAWGAHFEPDPPVATHGWFNPDLSRPDFRGSWFIGSRSAYAVNDYMFEIPRDWADRYAGGRYLATGRYRDGGWSGMGPSLYAYRPWTDDAGTPAPDGAHLSEIALLEYANSRENADIVKAADGYQHPDEWTGGAWLETGDGRTAVLFAGTKATGAKYWYGFINPAGPDQPCVHAEAAAEYTACRFADGSPCPAQDMMECAGHNDARGWWSSQYEAQFALYEPDDLAAVAEGKAAPDQPQPFATVSVDEHLFLQVPEWDADYVGRGSQREHRLDAVAYDRERGLLYVLEPYVDDGAPIVHVWRIGS